MSNRRRRILLTHAAASDLSDTLVHSEQEWGRQRRQAYGRLIREAIGLLADHPDLGRARAELAEGLRSHPLGAHILYYWSNPDELVVARILHGRRDPIAQEWDRLDEE